MTYIAVLVPILIFAVSVGLGFSKANWFLEFGLAIVVISSATSMALAFLGGRKAAQAKRVEYESFLPEIDDGQSHSFKFTAGMMGVDPLNPSKHFQDQIDELRRVSAQDEKTFRSLLRFTDRRLDICLAQIRYHEAVTLPKILGEGSGAIMLAGALAIIGSVYLAIPAGVYQAFSAAAGVVRAWLPAI
ncbi:hypothetical protein A8L59_16440 [Pseudomonas koreensis]|uniref:Uncharacterized protein n=1 Tax=Pseudomonas koreensis TaxID=198620 RepID=A0AAC9BU19_9PSED|nr:hypothetical protein [Pseudomonas koreensis]ANH98936.1 hypothetical protein A8L59_16440 [Pseudomonas koreensis]